MCLSGWSPLPCRRILAGSLRRRSIDDGAGNRLDPDEVILDGSDPRHILGGNAQRPAFLLIEDHAVEVDDPILDEKERGALRVAAENVPGVRTVEDHLVWVEPVSGTVIDAPREARSGEESEAGRARRPR